MPYSTAASFTQRTDTDRPDLMFDNLYVEDLVLAARRVGRCQLSLGARAYGNGCLHVGNISGFVTNFFQCSNQIHFIHISNVTSTFACNVITSNISVTFEM